MEFFNNMNDMLTENFGEFGPLLVVGILGLFLILMTLPILLRKTEDPLDKLKKSNAAVERPKSEALRVGNKSDKLEKYSNFLEPQTEEEFSAVRLKLTQAGYRTKGAVRMYHFSQFALGLLGLILGVIYAFVASTSVELTTQQMLMYVLIPAGAGYMGPKYWVNKRLKKRCEEITKGFPDALDLMLVCVEAGQSMDLAIIRVSSEIRPSCPELADEFEIVAQEMKAGKDKVIVLRDMADRAGVLDVSSFVTVLIQSQSFGTSISDALRVYALEMRDKRVMRAEEAANKLPTKMTLATMMLTLPPLLIILIGPSIAGIASDMNPATF